MNMRICLPAEAASAQAGESAAADEYDKGNVRVWFSGRMRASQA